MTVFNAAVIIILMQYGNNYHCILYITLLWLLLYHIFLEASKKILEYLAAISTSSDDVERIKDRLLESNPVLEVSTQWVGQCIVGSGYGFLRISNRIIILL